MNFFCLVELLYDGISLKKVTRADGGEPLAYN